MSRMALTLIEKDAATVDTDVEGGRIVVDPATFQAATGWEAKPEGMCRGTACVPVKGTGAIDDDGRIDVRAFAERLGQAVVHDADRGVVAIGGDPMARGQVASIADVTLPDLDGGEVDFARFLGRKTLLIAWASW